MQGWHTSPKLRVPLPRYAPEAELGRERLGISSGELLSHLVWKDYDATVDACCDGWNKLMRMPKQIASITTRSWARVTV